MCAAKLWTGAPGTSPPVIPTSGFPVADVLNHAYRPDGVTAATAFRFPYPRSILDLAVLTSVFTHMRPDDVRSYLAEIHRVLRPGGRCFITWFVLDNETRRLTAEHRSTLGFHWPQGECWAADRRRRRDRHRLRRALGARGL